MEEKLKKLGEIAQSTDAEAIFSGTPEQVRENLKNHGVELTVDEIKAFVKGILDGNNDELSENELATVAGGKTYPGYERDCYNAGRKICNVCKWVFRIGALFL